MERVVAVATKKQDPEPVKETSVEAHTDHAVLTVNGVSYWLDTELLLALRKQLDAAAVGANY